MKIRKQSSLVKLFSNPKHTILANSPELRFISAVCSGLPDEAVSLFRDQKLFGKVPPVVDAPYGRFEGLAEIHKFAENWLKVFHAESASITHVIQTRANGRSVTELAVNLQQSQLSL